MDSPSFIGSVQEGRRPQGNQAPVHLWCNVHSPGNGATNAKAVERSREISASSSVATAAPTAPTHLPPSPVAHSMVRTGGKELSQAVKAV